MHSSQSENQTSDAAEQLENLKNGIREVSHEINNPLGIIRMAVYFLQTSNPPEEKKMEYFKAIDEGLERIEQSLQQLKLLREQPSSLAPKSPPQS